MAWEVQLGEEFDPEYLALPPQVQDAIATISELLVQLGPQLGRPRVDTLNGSRYPNMKEMRFDAADGVWRVAFAFDPKRMAILLLAGDKSGGSENRFYREFIRKADQRFGFHLERLTNERK